MIAFIKSDSIQVEIHRQPDLTYFLVVKRAEKTLTIGKGFNLTLEDAYYNIRDYSRKNGNLKIELAA